MARKAGRPPLASRELLQEAAFELFQLQGYRATSVEQIARTAGFSRATFFNFFCSKAQLFWVETDLLIVRLRESLSAQLSSSVAPDLYHALVEFAHPLSSSHVPWALQNIGLLEASDDLIASGASRVLEVRHILLNYLQHHPQRDEDVDLIHEQASAAAATARLLTAITAWIEAGVTRGSLREYLERTN